MTTTPHWTDARTSWDATADLRDRPTIADLERRIVRSREVVEWPLPDPDWASKAPVAERRLRPRPVCLTGCGCHKFVDIVAVASRGGAA